MHCLQPTHSSLHSKDPVLHTSLPVQQEVHVRHLILRPQTQRTEEPPLHCFARLFMLPGTTCSCLADIKCSATSAAHRAAPSCLRHAAPPSTHFISVLAVCTSRSWILLPLCVGFCDAHISPPLSLWLPPSHTAPLCVTHTVAAVCMVHGPERDAAAASGHCRRPGAWRQQVRQGC